MLLIRWALALALAAGAAWPQGVIRLKTRTIVPPVSHPPRPPGGVETASPQHYLVLFDSYPGPDVLAKLATRHIVVDAYVPENALMVSASVLNLRGLGVVWWEAMDAADKISPAIATQPAGAYLLILQPDADAATSSELVEQAGFTIIPNPHLLAGQLLISGPAGALPALAALDPVAYILPASLALQDGGAIVGCAGALTPVGPTPQYVEIDNGWSRDADGSVSLQYFFDSLTPDVPESLVRSEIARAFAAWAQYADISFTPAAQPALERSVDILFARYAHGDAYPFDGPNGVLAHTFYPVPSNPEPIAGDMHLNADEPWSAGGTVDIYSVALHEIGHALGLGHSDNPGAVMYPYYRLQSGLTADDIAGVQAIYGKNTGTSSSSGSGTSGGTGTSGTTGTTSGGNGSTNSGADTTPPSLAIVFPASSIFSTGSANITVSGTASDNVGVVSVEWSTSTGGSGAAGGTTSWSAAIPLLVGNNTITVRAYDAAGNSGWRAVTVVRE